MSMHSALSSVRTQRLLLLLCVSVPSFMINLDANIVAVSLPAIARSMHANFAAIEWVVSAYTLTFASLVLPAGALADRYGRKRILLLGLGIFTVASFLCGMAPSIAVLNGARALQGVGAAFQLSAALAILSEAFSGTERAAAFAFWGAVVGVAIAVGPVAGGIITQAFGWEWAFYINVAIGVGLILLALYAVTESADPDAGRLDFIGLISFGGGVFALTLALISGNARGWSSTQVLLALGCAAVLFAGFLVAEARQRKPMVDLHLFERPTFVGANIAALAFAMTLLTMLTYLPIFFQSALGFGPRDAGLLMLPLGVPLFIVPRLVAVHLAHRLSGRALLTVGLSLVTAGLIALAAAVPLFNYEALVVGLVVAGIGGGVLNSEVVKVGMAVIPPERAGMASGVSGTVRFTGVVVGFAALGAVLAGRIQATLRPGVASFCQSVGDCHIDQSALVRSVVAGDLSGPPGTLHNSLHAVALASFGEGFQAILVAAAAFAALSAVLTWVFVRGEDPAPVERNPGRFHRDP
jgi:EmrB/QacA subfamily drug resistance transporter